ncbi:uncharacterized protein [Euphorbia lathyris]|uniref:uncharacterized protein isoform X2 n=1 Tax=Euphorbia lathyris TaxID=212925 RepID=UPI0033130EBC
MPSAWEYNKTRRGRARSSSSFMSHGRSGRKSSSSSVHNFASSDGNTYKVNDFVHSDKIIGIIKPYVETYCDVVGGGNCGFRVVSSYIFGTEEKWQSVRHHLRNEVIANCFWYESVLIDGVDAAINRISWDGGACSQEHWMLAYNDLFLIATLYNAAVMFFGYLGGNNSSFCGTVLPVYAPSTATRPEREIFIAHLGTHCRHYIRLNLSPNFPVPHVLEWWKQHHERSVEGWDRIYAARTTQWTRLVQLRSS